MKVNRQDFLSRLQSVEPGVSKQGTIIQSQCVVFRKNRLYSLSMEVACSIPSGLREEVNGAVNAEKLIALFKGLSDEDVNISSNDKQLIVKGKGTAKIAMEQDVLLPISEVEIPASDEWSDLHEEFAMAVDLTNRCTKKKDDFLKECVHVHTSYLDGCDNERLLRYQVESPFLKQSILVRGIVLKKMVPFGMTVAAETNNWLHFRNPVGLRLSCKKHLETNYPDHTSLLNLEGRKIQFPKSFAEVVNRAAWAAEEEKLTVRVSKDKLWINGKSVGMEYDEESPIRYQGGDFTFGIDPKVLLDLVSKSTFCTVGDSVLGVKAHNYTFLTSLEKRS